MPQSRLFVKPSSGEQHQGHGKHIRSCYDDAMRIRLRLPAPLTTLFLIMPLGLCQAASPVARPLSEAAFYPQRSAQGQVVSLNESRIPAEINARILRIAVEPGQVVKRGTLLALLDCRDYDLASERAASALQASEARLRLNRLQAERSDKLAAQGFISREGQDARQAELEVARADVAVQQALLRTARHTQGKCTLRSPFPAVVLSRPGQVGETANPGSPVVVLSDLSSLQVQADIQWRDAEDLKRAESVEFETQGRRYAVKLVRLSPALDRATRLMEGRLTFAKDSAPPGSVGRLVWTSREPHIRAEWLVRRGGRLGVYVMEAGKAVFMPLPEAQEGRPVPTRLPLTSLIVVQGQQALP